MIKDNRHIEIVRSSITRQSSMSQESCDAIFAVLSSSYARVGITIVDNLADLEALTASQPDLVFLGMKSVPAAGALGSPNQDRIWIAEYLDRHGIAYTGSGSEAHKLESSKPLAKLRVIDSGIRTSPFLVIKQNQLQTNLYTPLHFPLFIKPTSHGGGSGIDSCSLVRNNAELRSKVQSISNDLQSDSLVEEYLPGREFSVSILKDALSGELLVMPIELIAQPDRKGIRILSQQVKSSNSERAIKITDKITEAAVAKLAIEAFHALGARDYGRVDIRLDKTGNPHFLEANLLPSLISGYGSFPKACVLNINLGYRPMIINIAKLGLARNLNSAEDLPGSILDNPALLPTFETALEPI